MKTATTVVLGFAILILLSSCHRSSSTPPNAVSSNPTQPTTPPANATTANIATERPTYRPRIDACALLTTSEIASIQNESVKATKLSGAPDKGFDVSQCFFTLETFANSISLRITQRREGSGARDPREFWRATFDENEGSEDEREREQARKQAREKFDREEEEESAPPMRVAGIGDDAYWMGDQVGGALYVLKGHNYLRISVGGVGDRNAKIKKSTSLAHKVIDRLSS
jgi:hypothetical protein